MSDFRSGFRTEIIQNYRKMVILGGGFWVKNMGLGWALRCVDWAGRARKICETNKIEHVFAPNARAKSRKVRIKRACWRKKVGKIYKN
jgi:hypothetical protein